MSYPWEFANYHLDYEVADQQPTISIHTHAANIAALGSLSEKISSLQSYLSLKPFSHDEDGFGYGKTARIEESTRVLGWSALKFALPRPLPREDGYVSSKAVLLPVVSTATVTLSYLNNNETPEEALDPDHPRYMRLAVSNSPDPVQHNAAGISACLTPSMLDWLGRREHIEEVETEIRDAMIETFAHIEDKRQDGQFGVNLANPLRPSFNYPGDGTAFHATDRESAMSEGLRLYAHNNDYPYQQVVILSGLAVLNQIVLRD